jgi:hypothetical protein
MFHIDVQHIHMFLTVPMASEFIMYIMKIKYVLGSMLLLALRKEWKFTIIISNIQLLSIPICTVSQDSAVGIAIGYGLDD